MQYTLVAYFTEQQKESEMFSLLVVSTPVFAPMLNLHVDSSPVC